MDNTLDPIELREVSRQLAGHAPGVRVNTIRTRLAAFWESLGGNISVSELARCSLLVKGAFKVRVVKNGEYTD